MRLMLFLMLLAISHSHALGCDNLWETATVRSWHLKQNGQNEWNLGAGLECHYDKEWNWQLGYYRNSGYDDSLYIGTSYVPVRLYDGVRVGVVLNAVTGYNAPVLPMFAFLGTIEYEGYGLNLLFIPAAGGVFGLQLKVQY